MANLDRKSEATGTDICPVQLDALVTKLNELDRTATLEFALRVGRLIVQTIYAGDLSRWRAFGERDISFRKLAKRTGIDLRMSATTLYRSVALYELCSRLSAELWRDFGAAHLRAVLGVPEKDQVKLLSRAKAENLSVRELDRYAAAARGRILSSPPRHETRRVAKVLQRALSLLDERHTDFSVEEAQALRAL